MGVTGLWSLIEPAGKPVPLESLENKVLAVGLYNSYYFRIQYVQRTTNGRPKLIAENLAQTTHKKTVSRINPNLLLKINLRNT